MGFDFLRKGINRDTFLVFNAVGATAIQHVRRTLLQLMTSIHQVLLVPARANVLALTSA